MIRASFALLLTVLLSADVLERPNRIDGYGKVRFGMNAGDAVRMLGSQAVLEEVCGGRQAVTFSGRDGSHTYTAMAHVKHSRVVDVQLYVRSHRTADTRTQCLIHFNKLLALQQTRYRGYELLIKDPQSGWTREKIARLRFPDSSVVEVRSRYWPAGGTCYTYVTHLPPPDVTVVSRQQKQFPLPNQLTLITALQ
ncbi:MAG: hypothetical protein ACE5K1_07130 [Acidiferrobacterales bacterium]